MNVQLKANLQVHLINWLNKAEVEETLGREGMIQEDCADSMALIMASGCEAVLDGMLHQQEVGRQCEKDQS